MTANNRPALAVQRALKQLGADLRTLRLRRRLTMEVVAERARTSRPTLQRIERGDPGVGIGNYAGVMLALGVLPKLASLADPLADEIGLALMDDALPKRGRSSRPRKPDSDSDE